MSLSKANIIEGGFSIIDKHNIAQKVQTIQDIQDSLKTGHLNWFILYMTLPNKGRVQKTD